MAYALLFLRVVVGLTLFAHGAQKLFGWWEGPGQAGTRGWLHSMGFRLPAVMALLVGLGEGSGLLFALGLVTPLAALVMATAMVVAIGSVHLPKGWWLSKGGYEYNLVLWAVAVAVAGTGPGRFSIDRAIGWDDNISGVWWGVGALALSLLTGLFILTALRKQPAPQEAA
ncbi:MAG TPA: DoxX family protein [Gaiellaceae bacterium]|jgi:putative oxidoreductase|nr:DoxX family protein [Gaiellaceae bacterium]